MLGKIHFFFLKKADCYALRGRRSMPDLVADAPLTAWKWIGRKSKDELHLWVSWALRLIWWKTILTDCGEHCKGRRFRVISYSNKKSRH